MSGLSNISEEHPTPELFTAELLGGDRGSEAKAALLNAALAEFGRLGLEGARTREIAKRADQNMAAISYYFGGKEGLYLALVEAFTGYINLRLKPAVIKAEEALKDGETDRQEFISLIRHVLDIWIDAVLGHEETLEASLIVIREQMLPTSAFDLIFERVIGPIHRVLSHLLARAFGWPPDSQEAAIQAHCLIGQVLVFRAGRETIMRRTGWKTLGKQEVDSIRTAVHQHFDSFVADNLNNSPS